MMSGRCRFSRMSCVSTFKAASRPVLWVKPEAGMLSRSRFGIDTAVPGSKVFLLFIDT